MLGGRDRLPSDICEMISEAEEISAHGERATLVMCFNYGGQSEIVRAASRLITDRGRLTAVEQMSHGEEITVQEF